MRGPAAILGGPDPSGRMFSSKGEPGVPEVKPGTLASATGAPDKGLNRVMRRCSIPENVRPGCPTNGRVKAGDKPGGSSGTYPGREPEKFNGRSGTRERRKRP